MPRPSAGSGIRTLVIGSVAGALALAALVIGSAYGDIRKHNVDPVVIAATSAAAILVFGVIATTHLSRTLGRLVGERGVPSAGVATRLFTSGVGYLITAFALLAVLSVSVGKLLVGAGLAGVILGIAAQPSLGNLFAGIVLVLARPFSVGDHIRVRSGALGGLFDAWVMDVSLAYVTLRTDDGILKVPNASMLAAGVLQLTPDSAPLPAPAAGAATPSAPAPGPEGGGSEEVAAFGKDRGDSAPPEAAPTLRVPPPPPPEDTGTGTGGGAGAP